MGREGFVRAVFADANQTLNGVADDQFIFRSDGHACVKCVQRRDLLKQAVRRDLVDLTGFAAGPEIAFAIEGEALGVIETAGKDLETFDGNDGRHGMIVP